MAGSVSVMLSRCPPHKSLKLLQKPIGGGEGACVPYLLSASQSGQAEKKKLSLGKEENGKKIEQDAIFRKGEWERKVAYELKVKEKKEKSRLTAHKRA